MSRLFTILTGKHQGRKIRLKEEGLIIGRDPTANVRVGSSEVSRHHCRVSLKDGDVYVEDLESSNGTFINGKPTRGITIVQGGDVLTVGPMSFRLEGTSVGAHGARVAVRPADQVDQKASDADIASWLEEEADYTGGDTTLTLPAFRPAEKPAELASPPKKVFGSVREEAADIIRRHLEKVAAEESEDA